MSRNIDYLPMVEPKKVDGKNNKVLGASIGFLLGIVMYVLLFMELFSACFSLGGDYGPPLCTFFWDHLFDYMIGICPLLTFSFAIIGGAIGAADAGSRRDRGTVGIQSIIGTAAKVVFGIAIPIIGAFIGFSIGGRVGAAITECGAWSNCIEPVYNGTFIGGGIGFLLGCSGVVLLHRWATQKLES
jgi:hypothetical protein